MLKNRLFNIFIIISLVVMIVLTISQAIETTKVVSAASGSLDAAYCLSKTERLSLGSVYVEGAGWFPHTNNGPAGVDGGLIELLSNQRGCSTK